MSPPTRIVPLAERLRLLHDDVLRRQLDVIERVASHERELQIAMR